MKYALIGLALGVAGCQTTDIGPAVRSTCVTGERLYANFVALQATEVVEARFAKRINDAWAIIGPICAKPVVTETDLVVAAAQVYIMTKAWRDVN